MESGDSSHSHSHPSINWSKRISHEQHSYPLALFTLKLYMSKVDAVSLKNLSAARSIFHETPGDVYALQIICMNFDVAIQNDRPIHDKLPFQVRNSNLKNSNLDSHLVGTPHPRCADFDCSAERV
ncbi:hypothetical protein QAD02_002838 [Eretmocerus hayati]|uniref:Uncharacterized protein n=1 Tax=Eretmocerus hayati TaxID=131215 RepID=A0ACC2NKE2_9HYME|nr:hypothetical protein QAD02_002838 [Eretmocerus hayati]